MDYEVVYCTWVTRSKTNKKLYWQNSFAHYSQILIIVYYQLILPGLGKIHGFLS